MTIHNREFEIPPFFEHAFYDVSKSVIKIDANQSFKDNPWLKQQVPGWPDNINPGNFCDFIVPGGTARKNKPIVSRRTHVGMGRGLSALHLPLPDSPAAKQLDHNGTKVIRPGEIGVLDKETGMFYINIGTKGNGPTANEMARLVGTVPGLTGRLQKKEPFGILWSATAETIEKPTLDLLVKTGFRVGRVLSIFTLDGQSLAETIDPLYQAAGLGDKYSVARELKKGGSGQNPAIMARLIGGARADVLANPRADPNLVADAIYGWASEVAEGGLEAFINRYRFPETMRHDIEAIEGYDYSQPLEKGLSESYLRILSFLMWRNYCLQDEYNEKFSLTRKELWKKFGSTALKHRKSKGPIGPIWLNYKPGDWDVGGFIFDVDVFYLKMELAFKNGAKSVRQHDANSLTIGLSDIGTTLNRLDSLDWQEAISFGKQTARRVSKTEGFLPKNVERQSFYSDGR